MTISFMPDGTDLGGVQSNLFSAFNGKPQLAGQWQKQILRAAHVWATQTNLNSVVLPHNGAPTAPGGPHAGRAACRDRR